MNYSLLLQKRPFQGHLCLLFFPHGLQLPEAAWVICPQRLRCLRVGAHLWGLPVKDVINVHGLPELHVLKMKGVFKPCGAPSTLKRAWK